MFLAFKMHDKSKINRNTLEGQIFIEEYIKEMIEGRSDLHNNTALGFQSFNIFKRIINALQEHRIIKIFLSDHKYYLRNYNIFKFMCSKMKRSLTDLNSEEERLLAYDQCKEYLKIRCDSYT
jgi:hypothetical protein